MVAAYSAGRAPEPETEPTVAEAAHQLAQADAMLRQLVNEDAAAYRRFAEARKAGDPAELDRATGVALAVPMEIAAVATTALGVLDKLKERWNPNLISDLGVAAVLAEASVQAAAFNVRINLRGGDRADPRGEVREEIERMEKRARELQDSILGYVGRHL
jgi:formiminotetrahydrofolate cyclodeaminase